MEALKPQGNLIALQLQEIRKVTMARLFCDNMDNFIKIQPLVMRQVNDT